MSIQEFAFQLSKKVQEQHSVKIGRSHIYELIALDQGYKTYNAFIAQNLLLGSEYDDSEDYYQHELIDALRCVIEGKNYISKALRSNPTESSEDNFVKSLTLTKREKEIIALLTQEKSSQEIADALFISVYTVNTHRKNILHKLGIKNTAGLVKFALDNQLI